MIAEILNESPLELTTSVTDAVLAIECIVIIIYLRRIVADDLSPAWPSAGTVTSEQVTTWRTNARMRTILRAVS